MQKKPECCSLLMSFPLPVLQHHLKAINWNFSVSAVLNTIKESRVTWIKDTNMLGMAFKNWLLIESWYSKTESWSWDIMARVFYWLLVQLPVALRYNAWETAICFLCPVSFVWTKIQKIIPVSDLVSGTRQSWPNPCTCEDCALSLFMQTQDAFARLRKTVAYCK